MSTRLDLSDLRQLEADWDSYGASPISAEALRVAEALTAVPMSDGGVQLELHGGGADIEIEIDPAGRVLSVSTSGSIRSVSYPNGELLA